MERFIIFVAIVVIFQSCSDHIKILENKDFERGNWLLAIENHSEETLYVISDEQMLKDNKHGLSVSFADDHNYTTCDGNLQLFRDGELVEEQNFLTNFHLTIPNELSKHKVKAISKWIEPVDERDFQMKWDSLKTLRNTYSHWSISQPNEKKIIKVYQWN